MKNFTKLIFTLLLFTVGLFVSTNQVSAEVLEETVEHIQPVDILEFKDLPDNEKEIFLENGFDEEDTYTMSIIRQNPTVNPESEISTYALNVVKVFGSTKRVATNRAQSTYSVSSSQLPIISVSVKTTATGGGKTIPSTSTKKPGTKSTVVTTNTSYSGASTYFSFKGNTQVTTSAGVVPWIYGTSVGGTTLGF